MLALFCRCGPLGGRGEESVVKSCSWAWPTRQPQTLRPGVSAVAPGVRRPAAATLQRLSAKLTTSTEHPAGSQPQVGQAGLGRQPGKESATCLVPGTRQRILRWTLPKLPAW